MLVNYYLRGGVVFELKTKRCGSLLPPFRGTSGGYRHVMCMWCLTLGGNRGRRHVAARVAAIVPLLCSLSLSVSGFLSC